MDIYEILRRNYRIDQTRNFFRPSVKIVEMLGFERQII